MIVYDNEVIQIHNEQRYISKFVGMATARVILIVLLFFLFFSLDQIPVYLCAFCCLFPWIFSNILASKKKSTILLQQTASKYHFTKARYTAEKITNSSMIFFLIVWQLVLNRTYASTLYLQLAPALLLLIFLLIRFIITLYTKHKISIYYKSLQSLNEEHEIF